MNITKFLALSVAAAGLAFSANAYAAKEIKISSNNTSYSAADVQKLAATAVGMGVKEPVSLTAGSGVVQHRHIPAPHPKGCLWQDG